MAASKEYPIYIKTLTGSNTEVTVNGSDSVQTLKEKITAALKLSVPILRVSHKGKDLLEDSKTLAEYGVGQEAIVYLITDSEKPCHYFFALDESGSMSGGRWRELLASFSEFVSGRLEDAEKNGAPSLDRVSVFFHQTECRLATCRKKSGETVPFDDIALMELTADSLVNDFRSGGNNFNHALIFLEPYLTKCQGYTPVLMFMTDGGDCGDGSPRGPSGSFRQKAYNKMAELKKKIPELRLFVTVVFTNNSEDIEGAKKLCLAGGGDLATNFTTIGDEQVEVLTMHFDASGFCPVPDYADSGFCPIPGLDAPSDTVSSVAPVSFGPIPSLPVPPSSPASVLSPPSYSSAPAQSVQRRMASHWESVYQSCTPQMPKK